jgi:hypothetical protein
MSEHHPFLSTMVILKDLGWHSVQPSHPGPSIPGHRDAGPTRLSLEGRTLLTRMSSAEHRVWILLTDVLLVNCLCGICGFQRGLMPDSTFQVGNRKMHCCVNFRGQTRVTPYRSLTVGSPTDEDRSMNQRVSEKTGSENALTTLLDPTTGLARESTFAYMLRCSL